MTVAVSKPATRPPQGAPLKNVRDPMDVVAAYQQVGSYRGAGRSPAATSRSDGSSRPSSPVGPSQSPGAQVIATTESLSWSLGG